MLELTDEHYEPKKMVVAKITYMVDVNKDNVFLGQVEDFDGEQDDYEDFKMTDEELIGAVARDLEEMIYNAVKYNDVYNMIDVEILDA